MKTNQEPIILAERAADHGRLRSVLREWGYEESEIQRVLKEQRSSGKQEVSYERMQPTTRASPY